jgi:hypothetical protein
MEKAGLSNRMISYKFLRMMYEDRGDIAKVSPSEEAVWNKGFVEILFHDRGWDHVVPR